MYLMYRCYIPSYAAERSFNVGAKMGVWGRAPSGVQELAKPRVGSGALPQEVDEYDNMTWKTN